MKKYFIGILTTVAIALIVTINVNIGLEEKNSLGVSLKNVEALGRYELPEIVIECSYPHCSNGYKCHQNTDKWECYCKFTGSMSNTCIQ